MASLFQLHPILAEELVCPMCCNMLTEPMMLDCMHNFCKKCITRYWSSSKNNSSCPSCQKTVADKALRSNKVLNKLIEMMRTYRAPNYIHKLEKDVKVMLKTKVQEADTLTQKQIETQKKLKTVKETGNDLRLKVAAEFQTLREFLQKEEKQLLCSVDEEEEKALARLQDILMTLEKQFVVVTGQIAFIQKILTLSRKYSTVEAEKTTQSALSKDV